MATKKSKTNMEDAFRRAQEKKRADAAKKEKERISKSRAELAKKKKKKKQVSEAVGAILRASLLLNDQT